MGADIRALERRTERSASRLGLTATRRSPLPVSLPTLVSRKRALGNVAAFLDARREVLRDIEQPLLRPVPGPQTSPFGPRGGRMHEGVDIGGPIGTPVQAAASGVVVSAGWNEGYGRIVVIRHPGGLSTAYAHMSAITVARGRPVVQGDVVGRRGSTGHSTGPHLHFETRLRGLAVDPAPYLRHAPAVGGGA